MTHRPIAPGDSDGREALPGLSWLDAWLARDGMTDISNHLWDKAVRRPLRDFLESAGKQIRGRLVQLAWSISGRREQPPVELTLIIEFLHAGSLIVDDIQDNSSHRRGRPALHVSHGVPLALNTGNLLYFWANTLISELGCPPAVENMLYRTVSRALLNAHLGQGIDLAAQVAHLPPGDARGTVRSLTELKTGSLMELAAMLPAIAAEASFPCRRRLAEFGRSLGAALQMADDLSNLLGPKEAHKHYEDLCLGRPTWPWVWLAEHASPDVYADCQRELGRIDSDPLRAASLGRRMLLVVEDPGRQEIQAILDRAFSELSTETSSQDQLDQMRLLADQVQSLERRSLQPMTGTTCRA